MPLQPKALSLSSYLTKPIYLVILAFTAITITLLALQDAKFVGFIPTSSISFSRNTRTTWIRVVFDKTLEADAKRAAALPRYKLPSNLLESEKYPTFPVYVISMEGADERRRHITETFAQHNIDFEFKDAVNGLEPLPEDLVRWYTSGSRYQEYKHSSPGRRPYRKIAADLSHFLLMHKMIAQGDELQMVFEDDAVLCDDFAQKLNETLYNLPEDWELLWLNQGKAGQDVLSDFVGPSVRMFIDNSISQGLVYTRSFALKALNDAQLGNKPIDNLINDMIQLRRARGYVADPPLVGNAGFESQIENFK